MDKLYVSPCPFLCCTVAHFQRRPATIDCTTCTIAAVLLLLPHAVNCGRFCFWRCQSVFFVMAALWNRAGNYIFALWFLLLLYIFFPRLISAVADWMSAIFPHMVRPKCEFKMQVWNVLNAARWKYRTQKSRQGRHLGTIAQLCRAISS